MNILAAENIQDDLVMFAPEAEEEADHDETTRSDHSSQPPWKILIVDDEEQIHAVTRFTLQNYRYLSRPIEFYSAYSAEEAKLIMTSVHDIALIFLDVVMESTQAGLDLVEYIRSDLKNSLIRIVIRTGQPGYAPEEDIIQRYDINDYRLKTDLTHHKMWGLTTVCLRAYDNLLALEASRKQLQDFAESLEEKVQIRTGELRKANENLSYLVSEKNALVRTLSHDLKNYINIISGCVELHKKRESGQDKHEKLWKRIAHAINLQKELIQHILELEAVSSGKKKVSLQRVDLCATIEQARFAFRESLEDKNIHLAVHMSSPAISVRADPVAFGHSVFNNILSNAIKFSPAGEEVSIHVSETNSKKVIIEIRDHGIGMPKSILEGLFQTDSQTSRTGTAGEKGTGFGMPIVKRYIDLFGGEIDVSSQEAGAEGSKHGSCFRLTLDKWIA
ncbi:MAG: hybrid sensor histidine kinase/response regulator [Deltaproteobacteria bacterium]|nr:hybrid sensor histidine kinase/response regulator [Deltaproteobacteria bacterium]